MNLNASESNIISGLNFRDLIIFIVPTLIFSLYLFVFSPGVLTVASYSQIHQIVTGQFTNAHPIFHTLFEIACLKLFKSPFFIGLVQILIFSVLWMIICKYHRNDLANSSNEFVIQFVITLIICLIPINAVYSITLSSNILFSYSLMFLCFLIKVMVDEDGQIDSKLIILIGLTLAIMSGLSTYGIYIALFSLITIIYYLFGKNPPENTYILIVGITLVCILLVGSLNFIYNVDEDTLNLKTNDAFEEGINLENTKTEFFSSINAEPTDELENTASANIGKSNYNLLDSFVNIFRENFILDGLFNNPIICMVLSIVLLVLIISIIKTEEIGLIYAPVLINIVLVVITGQNNLYSNILIFYLITIIFLSLYFKIGFNLNDLSYITQIINKPEEIKTFKTPQVAKQRNYEVNSNYPIFEPQNEIRHDEEIKEEEKPQDEFYDDFEEQLKDLTFEDLNEILDTSEEEYIKNDEYSEESSSDLVDEILKEIKMSKK